MGSRVVRVKGRWGLRVGVKVGGQGLVGSRGGRV